MPGNGGRARRPSALIKKMAGECNEARLLTAGMEAELRLLRTQGSTLDHIEKFLTVLGGHEEQFSSNKQNTGRLFASVLGCLNR